MNAFNLSNTAWNTISLLFLFFTGGAGVILARDLKPLSYIHSREIFCIAIRTAAERSPAICYPVASGPKKRKGGRADTGGLQPENDIDASDAASRVLINSPSTRKAQPKPKTHMKHTIILICKGDTPPMKSIVDLLSQSGFEIEHASRRQGRKTHIEIGTPQDLEEVPLPKEVQNLKLTPELEAMFRKLIEIDQQGTVILSTLRSFERYEKKSDKAKDGEVEGGKKRGKKNEGGGAAAGDDADPDKEAPEQEQNQPSEGTDGNTEA